MQAVLATESNGMLHLVQCDFCNGTVDVAVVREELEGLDDGAPKIIILGELF